MPHPVIHAEIRSTDPDATRDFFGKLFGWTYSDGAFPGYTFADIGVDGAPATAIPNRVPARPLRIDRSLRGGNQARRGRDLVPQHRDLEGSRGRC